MQIPNSELFIDSLPPVYSNPEMEQIVVLAICGHRSRCKSGLFLGNTDMQFIAPKTRSYFVICYLRVDS